MTVLNLQDPALSEKIGDFLFAQYNRCREQMLANKKTKDEGEKEESEGGDKEATGTVFSLGKNNYPEDDISHESVAFLTSTYSALKSLLSVPPPELSDRRKAAAVLLSRHTLAIAETYLLKIFLFLATDRRYHPGNPVRIDAVQALTAESFDLAPMVLALADILFAVKLGRLFPAAEATIIANELRILQLSAAVFFDTLGEAFNLKSVCTCRSAFDRLMQSLGSEASLAAAANYVRRHETMYSDIVEQRAHGDAPLRPVETPSVATPPAAALEQRIAALQDGLAANTRAVANMDRRQRDFLAGLKKQLGGFVRLFRPSQPAPSPEQVAEALTPKRNRYACLQRIAEPHRSQLKTVIDYTVEYPIVLKAKTRDDFTLSNAARVVWNRHHESWSKVPGSFETFDKLKAACYHLQGKDDDPFCYST